MPVHNLLKVVSSTVRTAQTYVAHQKIHVQHLSNSFIYADTISRRKSNTETVADTRKLHSGLTETRMTECCY